MKTKFSVGSGLGSSASFAVALHYWQGKAGGMLISMGRIIQPFESLRE